MPILMKIPRICDTVVFEIKNDEITWPYSWEHQSGKTFVSIRDHYQRGVNDEHSGTFDFISMLYINQC